MFADGPGADLQRPGRVGDRGKGGQGSTDQLDRPPVMVGLPLALLPSLLPQPQLIFVAGEGLAVGDGEQGGRRLCEGFAGSEIVSVGDDGLVDATALTF